MGDLQGENLSKSGADLDHEMLEAMVSALRDSPDLTEVEVRQNGALLRLRRAPAPAAAPRTGRPAASRNGGAAAAAPAVFEVADARNPTPVRASAEAGAATNALPTTGEISVVTAGLVGIFRARQPQPVGPGDTVTAQQSVGHIEAMRLKNECLAPIAGRITAVRVEDGQPVEYGQPLLEIAPEETS